MVQSVKTLSGGETFLPSLALALALADGLADLGTGAHGVRRWSGERASFRCHFMG